MHHLDVILTFTGGLTAALLFGFLTQKARLSPIVGYLLAGIVVGPFTPGYVANASLSEQFAELGVILLMFGVGLQFHLEELLAVRRVALPGALLQIAVATALGILVARTFGWSLGAGAVFGLCISVASTVVLLRVLSDFDALHTPAGHLAVGWLVVEDVFTVVVLVLLPALAGPGAAGEPMAVAAALGLALVKIGGLVALTFVLGRRVFPAVLGYVAKTRSRELFTLTVLVLALGVAVGSAELFGASMALGAFLAGMVVGQSEFGARAASEALPMRDAFAVLFFVSVGMLLDPRELLANAGLTAATLAVVLVGKGVTALVVALAFKQPTRTALAVAVALAQIGEFSFMLAVLGRSLGLLPTRASAALVATSIVSITLNPLLFRLVGPAATWLDARRLARGGAAPSPSEPPPPSRPLHRAVVVGYGPVGRTIVRLLRENGLAPTVVELNHETVRSLLSEGVDAVYGDASQPEILARAGIAEARGMILAASGPPPEAAIRAARERNPDLLVLARASYLREVGALRKAGADVVVPAEREVALAMTEALLVALGATGEQLDRARDRVRSDLGA